MYHSRVPHSWLQKINQNKINRKGIVHKLYLFHYICSILKLSRCFSAKIIKQVLNLKNLGTRIFTGVIFICLLIGGILFNQYTFLIVFSIITSLALYEFYGLLSKAGKTPLNKILNTIGGLCLFISAYFFFSSTSHSLILLVPYAIYLLILFVSELYAKHPNPILSLAYAVLGQMYIAIPLSLLNFLAFGYKGLTGSYHHALLLALFIFIWVNDSFAYLTGSLFGKHRLFERVSPKKSWEGFIGGALFSIVAAIIYAQFYTELPLWAWIGFAVIMISAGTLGDLIESLMKRTLDVKDSGDLLPGHGGILDRIDSVIFSIPAQFVYLELVFYIIHS